MPQAVETYVELGLVTHRLELIEKLGRDARAVRADIVNGNARIGKSLGYLQKVTSQQGFATRNPDVANTTRCQLFHELQALFSCGMRRHRVEVGRRETMPAVVVAPTCDGPVDQVEPPTRVQLVSLRLVNGVHLCALLNHAFFEETRQNRTHLVGFIFREDGFPIAAHQHVELAH